MEKILMIAGRGHAAARSAAALDASRDEGWQLHWRADAAEGCAWLARHEPAAAILALDAPDETALSLVANVADAAPSLPILVLVERSREALAVRALAAGAVEYLLTEYVDDYWLPRLLRSACARKGASRGETIIPPWSRFTLDSIGDAVICLDDDERVTYVNRIGEALTGWPDAEARGHRASEVLTLVDAETRAPVRPLPWTNHDDTKSEGPAPDWVLVRRDGVEHAIEESTSPIVDGAGHVLGAVLVFRDVSPQRAVSRRLTHLAYHDVLTNLPNRLLLADRMVGAVQRARRQRQRVALLFVDLDGFKALNDAHGHACGDELLKAVARRLVASLRESDSVCRYGGDEFVVMLSEIGSASDARRSATKIRTALAQPYALSCGQVRITASIGVGLYPDDGADGEAVLRAADWAMYRAKRSRRRSQGVVALATPTQRRERMPAG